MATGEVNIPWSKEVTLEIERATDVEASTWHGWFKDEKYKEYEKQITLRDELLCGWAAGAAGVCHRLGEPP